MSALTGVGFVEAQGTGHRGVVSVHRDDEDRSLRVEQGGPGFEELGGEGTRWLPLSPHKTGRANAMLSTQCAGPLGLFCEGCRGSSW
jgi:hypothetical protein